MPNTTKRCCTCDTNKPLDAFNRYAKSPDGRQRRCRECQRVRRIEWYQANREREIAKAREWNLANPERVREIDRARYWRNPEARNLQALEYHAKNGDAIREQRRRKRAENLEASRENERIWRSGNRDSIAARKRVYRKVNPNIREQERANSHRRRAATKAGPSASEIKAKMSYYGHRCWICGDSATSIDHVKPLLVGGAHVLANLRPACLPCNSRKRARWYGVSRLDELTDWVLLRLSA